MNYSNSQRAGVILYLTASLFGGYILSAFPGFYLLLELFFLFVTSLILHCFFLQIRIILIRFYFSFIWFQSWCTQIVPTPQIYNNHLCASIAKLANATCSSSFKLFAWSIANFILSFSSVDSFRLPLSKNILIIPSIDVLSYLFSLFYQIRYTHVANYNFSKFSSVQLGHDLGHFDQDESRLVTKHSISDFRFWVCQEVSFLTVLF